MIDILLGSAEVLVAIAVLLGVSAFFSSSETAVFNLGRQRIAEIAAALRAS